MVYVVCVCGWNACVYSVNCIKLVNYFIFQTKMQGNTTQNFLTYSHNIFFSKFVSLPQFKTKKSCFYSDFLFVLQVQIMKFLKVSRTRKNCFWKKSAWIFFCIAIVPCHFCTLFDLSWSNGPCTHILGADKNFAICFSVLGCWKNGTNVGTKWYTRF